MNLSGFCHADQKDCAGAQASPSQGSLFSLLQTSPYKTQSNSVFDYVTSALYRIAAAIGRNLICPHLPGIGETIAVTAVNFFGFPEEIALGPAITVTANALAFAVGGEAGKQVQKQLCS